MAYIELTDIWISETEFGFNWNILQEKLQIQNSDQLKEMLIEHCLRLDMKDMAKDVQPFLFNARDVKRVELFIEFVKSASW